MAYGIIDVEQYISGPRGIPGIPKGPKIPVLTSDPRLIVSMNGHVEAITNTQCPFMKTVSRLWPVRSLSPKKKKQNAGLPFGIFQS